jgi:hypothetical protein
MNINQLLSVGVLGFFLVACGKLPISDKLIPQNVNIYQAHDIANRQINFIWIELPSSLDLGINQLRVFMARTDPPGMLIPTESELPCIIQADNVYLDLRPATLPFEFDGSQLAGSYQWMACASCVECYMNWETTLEIVGTIEQDKMVLSIGVRHMGHNIQDDFLRVELWPEEPRTREPRIQCRRANDCREVEFVQRLQD